MFEFVSHPIDGVIGVAIGRIVGEILIIVATDGIAESIMGYLPEIANKIKNGERVERIVDSIRGSKGAAKADLDGIRIINKKYAGKTYELTGDLAKKYPNGVKFSEEGFPNFEPYSIKKVTVNNLEGDAYYDFIKANEAAGFTSTPKGYTWHHVEDGRTLILVPSDLHGTVRHTGGASLIKKGIRP
ncbi:HNH endonuclease signature motif containing protein [Clostridium septicum]|uniref:HNH endonuclease n=1 Tax=Clostridium septicum TaxID=1504 RepID=A0ABY5B034_CLOSE|nr:HNH endonuclease [Clostridium septicum]UEC21414.1 HNH endonuclease [Clostridium septicum]USS00539.1 HNH endonuclease [Clostridium septicum]